MEKLTLEHIAPYLPYGLKVKYNKSVFYITSTTTHTAAVLKLERYYSNGRNRKYHNEVWLIEDNRFQPILCPMDLTKPIIVEGEVYILSDYGEAIYKEQFIFRNSEIHKCTIIDGADVGFRGTKDSVYGDRNVYWQNSLCKKVLASTSKLEGVAQLDRKHFVKPKVDVEELAKKAAYEIITPTAATGFYSGFLAGYNAKEAEFTEDDLRKALAVLIRYPKLTIDYVLNKLRALSLPKSITTDENYNVISVQW